MGNYRILIADDEANIVKIMEFELKKNGYDVLTAFDGEEALWIAERDHPDLIISDIMMPKMDGYELCRRVKANPDLRAIPFIFLTAKTGIENKVQGYAIGGEKYITKPCNRAELLKIIDMRLKYADKAKKLFAEKAKKFQGDLSIISIFSLLDMFFMGSWSGKIELAAGDGRRGRIEIANATIGPCTIDGRPVPDALTKLLAWNQGTFIAEHE
ncbi:MAG TPA: response regulator [Candidatus Edwardsbacteria bacterium]|nr:response regulator [Candidatus Edwardsbacteria bacterium]